MTLAQSIMLGILYFLANSNLTMISYVTIYRPLVGGFITGLILGDPVTGTMVGATINMMFIGFISAGGALPSDMALAGILGTALAITGGLDANAALAIAVPLGLLGTLVWVGRMTFDSFFNRWTDKIVASGSLKGLWLPTIWIPQLFLFCITGIPVMLACYFGADAVANVINALGSTVMGVLFTIGGIMPALGIAITLKFIFKGDNKPFFFLGFLLAAYSGLSMIGIGFFSLLIALIYTQVISHIDEAKAAAASSDEEFGFDLGDDDSEDAPEVALTEEEAKPSKKLSKNSLIRSFFTWEWSYQACYNYENMQAGCFLDAMAPAINELYADDPEEYKRACARHFEFYNIENTTGGAVLGLVLAMEEQRASGQDVTEDAIRSVKTGLMGPLSGIGDSTVQGVILPLALSFAISMAQDGSPVPVVIYVIFMAAVQLGLAWFMFNLGYKQGSNAIIDLLESGTFKNAIAAAGILGCTVIGALIVNYVSCSCAIQIPQGSDMFSVQTGFLDVICPGLLPLLVTLLAYKLVEKGWSSVKVLGVLVLIAIVGNLCGILA